MKPTVLSVTRHGTAIAVTLLLGAFLGVGAMFLPSEATSQEEVLARVNGIDITEADVAFAAEMYAGQIGNMPEDARRSAIVDALIEMRVAADAAKTDGIDKSDRYRRQMTFFEGQTLRSLFMEKMLAESVTDDAVKQAYDEYVAKLPPVEELRIRHILVATEPEAQEIMVALKAGSDFAALASERSKDEASKAKGGDLGFIAVGQSLPELEAAAAKLQPGQYSDTPAKSAFGFHVVKLEERRNRPAPPFEAMSEQIRASLEGAAAQKLMADLRAGAKVEKLIPDVAPPAGEDGHNHGDAESQAP